MSRKIIHRVIGLIVVCTLLTGSLVGCSIMENIIGERPNDDTSERSNESESSELISDNIVAETPAAKTLRRETWTASGVSNVVMRGIDISFITSDCHDTDMIVTEYLESGLGVRSYSTNGGDNEYEAHYDYDAYGVPLRMYMNDDDDTEAVIEITNYYENGQIISAQISDIILSNGESYLDTDRMPDATYKYLFTLLRFLQHYDSYRNATISIRNSENCIRLQDGEVVYYCVDDGRVATTEITKDSNGHRVTLTSSGSFDAEGNELIVILEVDEYGRMVKYGQSVGQRSGMIFIDYDIQAGLNAHLRTEVGHIADIQNDLLLGYSNEQLNAMFSQQLSSMYTFADNVLVFSEVKFGTQIITSEYSTDGLLVRQVTKLTDVGDDYPVYPHSIDYPHSHSVVIDYEYQ